MTVTTKNFTLPSTAKSLVEDDILYITGVANTGTEDLVGDVVTMEALQQICDNITTHNLHLDHDTGLVDGVLGPLVEGWIEEDGLHYKARILNEKRPFIESYLEQGVNLGSSISGVCEYETGSNSNIADWQLTEISLTAVPCDQGTMATVRIAKSFVEAVQAVQENMKEGDKMEEQKDNLQQVEVKEAEATEQPVSDDVVTVEKVEELINIAFNEKQEDLIEAVRGELKSEYETALNELRERVETLESQGDVDEEEADEAEPEAPEASEGEGESKATTDEEDEEKPDADAESEDEEEDDDEEDEKSIQDMISKTVQEEVRKLFNPHVQPQFNYKKEAADEKENKKSYTPAELAEMLTRTE